MLSKVPKKVHDINNKAFDLGIDYAKAVYDKALNSNTK